MTPIELLITNTKSGVFKNQTDLVEQIVSHPDSKFFERKRDTTKSLLSKTLHGKKRLSANLKDSIITVLEDNENISTGKVDFIKQNIVKIFSEAFDSRSFVKKYNKKRKIKNDLFISLELKSKNIEVNCITSNLDWANNYIDDIINSAKTNNAVYKYLLVDPLAEDNLDKLKELVSSHNVEDKIQFKKMYKHIGFHKLSNKEEYERVYTADIMFPLFEDLVIYKSIPEEIKREFGINLNEMVVIGSTVYDESYERLFSDFIESNEIKVRTTSVWFSRIWKAID